MATLVFKFSSWVHDVLVFGIYFYFPWNLKARMTMYDTDFDYYKARISITAISFYAMVVVVFKIMAIMDKSLDLKIKRATLKAKEELAEYIKLKKDKLNES